MWCPWKLSPLINLKGPLLLRKICIGFNYSNLLSNWSHRKGFCSFFFFNKVKLFSVNTIKPLGVRHSTVRHSVARSTHGAAVNKQTYATLSFFNFCCNNDDLKPATPSPLLPSPQLPSWLCVLENTQHSCQWQKIYTPAIFYSNRIIAGLVLCHGVC